MTISIFLFIGLFIVSIQAAVPYLLKRNIVFGVTIPNTYTDESTLSSYKRSYSLIIASTGIIAMGAFALWALSTNAGEEKVVLTGTAIQFGILLLSMALYFLFHAKISRLKHQNHWGTDLKQVRITDLAIRTADEMLPWTIYLLPMLITIGLIAYTVTQYANLPELIPTHWGIDGQPDAFSKKTPFSSIALLLILFIMQGMMLAINEFTKRSGIKISATNKKKSRAQQLSFRKYSSWFLFAIVLLMTVLFGFLQLGTIHEDIGNPALLFALPIGFLVIIFILTGIYAFKVGQGGTRLDVDIIDEDVEGITDYDDDRYWKGGIIYFNKNDPSIFVEKRFGVGWSLNFGHPIGYFILFGPILLILAISFFM
ncbi:DUF1648 domain-containing protein [Sporosarcina sp. G11-34]|uniref:DUF1648 domain-containing protein n=1 Tax=Sporosarcina sp. G11-34 TaxID=2849605 RepID=UPI0022A9A094|nr:DUF5808 domain-containing protein [Sporosarcina sp. G11-34]MCZ2258022.1 DUF1648 domain-containing protein [Sporosarcina sp. G11-34]